MTDEKKIEYYHIDSRRSAVLYSSFDDFSLNEILRDVREKLIADGTKKSIAIPLTGDQRYLYARYFPEADEPDAIKFETSTFRHDNDLNRHISFIYDITIDAPLDTIDELCRIIKSMD